MAVHKEFIDTFRNVAMIILALSGAHAARPTPIYDWAPGDGQHPWTPRPNQERVPVFEPEPREQAAVEWSLAEVVVGAKEVK